MPADEINCAVLLAAGRGTRMQGSVDDKILAPIQGRPVFTYSLSAFAACELISTICIVYRDEAQREQLAAAVAPSIGPEVIWARGGGERQDSVRYGLEAIPAEARHTLIHDCARPLVRPDLIRQLIETTRRDGAASPAHPVTDTIKRLSPGSGLRSAKLEDLQRERLWAMETPQAFRHSDILRAYRKVEERGLRVTDDCAAAAVTGIKMTLLHNTVPNPKITTRADLDYAAFLQRKHVDGAGKSNLEVG
jgi:2-C-methyl-D-erythritol 4-phosphate cytidylyltransferase